MQSALDFADAPQGLLGYHVAHPIYGLDGTVMCVALQLNGNVRVMIQPPRKDDKPIEPEWVDLVGLDLLDQGFAFRAVPLAASAIKLGDTVQDTASKFTGVVIDATMSFSGCVQHGVIAEPEKPGKAPVIEYFDHARLVVIHDQHVVKDIPQARTGGPPTRGRP